MVHQYVADKKEVKEHKKEVASIQPKVKNAESWDVVLFGKKRKPTDPIAPEYVHETFILDHLAELSNQALLSLAAAIFAGSLALDESFSPAQFMVELNQDNEITRFTRIDLSASGRFGLARLENKDFKLGKTSDLYTKSGQISNRYVDYLLKDPNVMVYVCVFWSDFNKKTIDELVSDRKECFCRQINKIPDDLRQDTLNRIYDIYTEKSSITRKISQNITQKQLEDMMGQVLEACVIQMQKEGVAKIKDLLNQVELDCKEYQFSRKKLEFGIVDDEDSLSGVYDIACLINKRITNLHSKSGSNLNAVLSQSYQILAYMYAQISIAYQCGAPLIPANIIELLQIKIILLQKLIQYKDHLQKSLLQNGAPTKIILVSEAIGRLFVAPLSDYSEIIDTLKPICEPRLVPMTIGSAKGNELFGFLQKQLKKMTRLKSEICDKEEDEECMSLEGILDFFGMKPKRISDKLQPTLFSKPSSHSNLKPDSKSELTPGRKVGQTSVSAPSG